MVGGEPEATTQNADPPAEAVGDGTDRWRRAGEGGEAIGRGGLDDLRPDRPRLEASRTVGRVHRNRLHPAGVDEEASVGSRGGSVPGGLDSDAEAIRTGEVDRSHDITGRAGADDESGMLADRQVESGVRGLVALITRNEDRSGHAGRQTGQLCRPSRSRRIGRERILDVRHHVLGRL